MRFSEFNLYIFMVSRVWFVGFNCLFELSTDIEYNVCINSGVGHIEIPVLLWMSFLSVGKKCKSLKQISNWWFAVSSWHQTQLLWHFRQAESQALPVRLEKLRLLLFKALNYFMRYIGGHQNSDRRNIYWVMVSFWGFFCSFWSISKYGGTP